MKPIAIIVYVPSIPALIRQFFGLYYSVMMHPELKQNIDFLVGCERGMEHLFQRESCIVVHTLDLSRDDAYKFKLMGDSDYAYINSWSHFADENSLKKILEYQYALRIDVDTFVSPNLLNIGIGDDEVLTGTGGYIGGQETIDNLVRISKELNMNHRGIHNIGSTWFTAASTMVDLGLDALNCAQYLLQEEFSETGEWPIWYAPVTTMYAGEIALNHSGLEITIDSRIDSSSATTTNIGDIYTIHCWHTDDDFSKHKYMQGNYQDTSTPLNIESCRDYALFCMRLAETVDTGAVTQPNLRAYTPAQAIRTAAYLLRQAIPKLPREIKRKYFKR